MNRWILPVVILLAAACSSKQSASTDPVVRGERAFNGLGCVKCHVIGDSGHNWGPDLTMLGFRKSAVWIDQWLKNPHEWNPKTVMPNFNLDDAARADLVAYLSAQKGQAWKEKPWKTAAAAALPAAERGKIVFNSVGCVTCHAKDGYGGYPNNNVAGGLIPSLSKVTEGYSKHELLEKIKAGAVPIPVSSSQPKPLLEMPKWGGQLDDSEINAVVEYLWSLAPKKKGGKPAADDF
ncbi:MAG: cytochrome c [Elusimicrobiota bacterium]|nr:MAG: cytochrome c [Elusimicrobiota bacterium]